MGAYFGAENRSAWFPNVTAVNEYCPSESVRTLRERSTSSTSTPLRGCPPEPDLTVPRMTGSAGNAAEESDRSSAKRVVKVRQYPRKGSNPNQMPEAASRAVARNLI